MFGLPQGGVSAKLGKSSQLVPIVMQYIVMALSDYMFSVDVGSATGNLLETCRPDMLIDLNIR